MNPNRKIFQGIDTLIIRVSDITRSKEWYQNKLGLNPIDHDPDSKLVVLDTSGPTSLTLWQTEHRIDINKTTASYPIFSTADAHASRSELKQNGVQVGEVIEDDFVNYFFFFDPDGNVLEGCQVHG